MSFNILIVDDSATTRGLIKRALSLSGLSLGDLYEAGHGREAMEQLSLHQVNLVLTDLHMPEMSGIELAKALFANPKTASIPVAVVSAEPSSLRLVELRRAGVKGYLRKPCTAESLRNLVAPIMEAQNA